MKGFLDYIDYNDVVNMSFESNGNIKNALVCRNGFYTLYSYYLSTWGSGVAPNGGSSEHLTPQSLTKENLQIINDLLNDPIKRIDVEN